MHLITDDIIIPQFATTVVGTSVDGGPDKGSAGDTFSISGNG
jgi:hypothetical protein